MEPRAQVGMGDGQGQAALGQRWAGKASQGDSLTGAQVTTCGPRALLNLTIVVCKVAMAPPQQWPSPG